MVRNNSLELIKSVLKKYVEPCIDNSLECVDGILSIQPHPGDCKLE